MALTTIIVRASIALVAYASLRRSESVARAAGPWIAGVWIFAGVYFPDVDLLLPLDHRSILTHSILPVLVLGRFGAAPAAGLAVGMGIHLSADLFPHAWEGFALIQVPLAGSLGRLGSPAWILANAWLAILIGVAGLRSAVPDGGLRRVIHVGIAALAGWYLVLEEGSLLAPVVFAVGFAVAVGRTRPDPARVA